MTDRTTPRPAGSWPGTPSSQAPFLARASKVPDVGFGFWSIKLLSTAMGEATSDFLVHRFWPPGVVLVAAAVFAASLG